MEDVYCPECKKLVKPEKFGDGWVGICCNRVVFSRSDESESGIKHSEDENIQEDDQS